MNLLNKSDKITDLAVNSNGAQNHFWLGLRTQGPWKTSQFGWTDQSPMDYANPARTPQLGIYPWSPAEPNYNFAHAKKPQNCVHMIGYSSSASWVKPERW